MSDTAIDELLCKIVSDWSTGAEIDAVMPITPDASARRYFRLHLSNAPQDTAVAMVFDSVDCPEVGGGPLVQADAAVVELTEFFRANQIAVPELFFDARDRSVLLIEDVGDTALFHTLASTIVTHEQVDGFYRAAIDQIIAIQNIPRKKDFFPFQRSFTKEVFVAEMQEFNDYMLRIHGADSARDELVASVFDEIASKLLSAPQVLCHRDFHSWNLMIDRGGALRVIDFQDALLGPRCYDIIGLLNDRDTDAALGADRYEGLLEYFRESLDIPAAEFAPEYLFALLQRDLKVAGRFSKLAAERGLGRYLQWVGGTVSRIKFTLLTLTQSGLASDAFKDFLETIERDFDVSTS